MKQEFGEVVNFELLKETKHMANPLQYSCLENPVDGGAWWAAVHGVAQSWTRLKQLSMQTHTTVQRGWLQLKSILDTDDRGPNTLRTHVPPPERYLQLSD